MQDAHSGNGARGRQLRAWAVALAGCVLAVLIGVSIVASARWEAQADYEKGNEEREIISGREAAGKRASITDAASVGTSANGRAPGAPAGRPAHSTSHAQVHDPPQGRGHSMILLEPRLLSQAPSPEGASSPNDSMTLTSGDVRDIHHLARLKEEVSLNALPSWKPSLDHSQGPLGYAELHHHESVAYPQGASDIADSPSPRVDSPPTHPRTLGAHEHTRDTLPRKASEFPTDLPLPRVGAGAASMAESGARQNNNDPTLGAQELTHELAHELAYELASPRVGAGKEKLSLVS